MRQGTIVAGSLLLAMGCATDGELDDGAGRSGTPTGSDELKDGLETGGMGGSNLRVYLTDAPGDFDEVWVNIARVEIARGTGEDAAWTTLRDEPFTVDLLTLQDDVTAVMADAALEPDHYAQLRMIVASADVVIGGEVEALTIPSGAQTGIKLDLDFQVEEGMTYGLVLDFDAHQSIKRTGNGKLMMTPVIVVEHIGPIEPEVEAPTGDGEDTSGDDAGGGGDDGEEPPTE
jgi:hypothetical protein